MALERTRTTGMLLCPALDIVVVLTAAAACTYIPRALHLPHKRQGHCKDYYVCLLASPSQGICPEI